MPNEQLIGQRFKKLVGYFTYIWVVINHWNHKCGWIILTGHLQMVAILISQTQRKERLYIIITHYQSVSLQHCLETLLSFDAQLFFEQVSCSFTQQLFVFGWKNKFCSLFMRKEHSLRKTLTALDNVLLVKL